MSEERLSPHLDGTGGGFGKHKGMTVRQMSEQFERIVEDVSMRSFTAVIRISREQVEARGQLGVNKYIVIGCAIAAAISFIVAICVPGRIRETMVRGGLACAGASVAFGIGVLRTREHTRAALAQERAIRDITVDALVKIASNPTFKPKPLDFTQRIFLQETLKKSKRDEPALTAILEIPGAE